MWNTCTFGEEVFIVYDFILRLFLVKLRRFVKALIISIKGSQEEKAIIAASLCLKSLLGNVVSGI